ncbi:MAG: VWA domain-containing protein [Terracidiphilus sp.]|jgi:VWFA-related protein
MRGINRFPLVFFTLLWSVQVLAQQTPLAQPTSTLKLNSRLVYVDVVVRDSHGHFVHGLKQQDFQLFEDGKPQALDFFEPHIYDSIAVPTTAQPTTQPAAPAEKLTFSNVDTRGADSGAINILLFDLLNTPVNEQIYARRQMMKFLRELPSGQRVALFILNGQLLMLQGFTGRSDLLSSVAKLLDPKDFHLLRSQNQQELEADNLERLFDLMGFYDPGGVIDHFARDMGRDDAISTDVRARITIAAIAQLARATSGYPGRKNLLWLSASFPLAVSAWLENSPNPYEGEDVAHSQADLHYIREAINLIASSQIAVYPISVLGTQMEGTGVDSNGDSEFNDIGRRLGTDREGQFTGRQLVRYAMNDIAEQTGGRAFYGSNDMAGALQQGIQEGSNYYTLAYRPQNPKWNGNFRKIRVNAAQNGLSLTYRRGYFALPETIPSSDAAQELLGALQPKIPDATMLRLKAKVTPPDEKQSKLQVTANINASDVKFTIDEAGHRHAQLLVLLLAYNDGAKQANAPPQSSGMLNIDLDAQRYQTVLEHGIAFQLALPVPSGNYRLRLGVSDTSNHHIGTLDMPVNLNTESAEIH